MAKITASLFIALDGVVEIGNGEWHFPYFSDEMGAAVDAGQGAADTMLFGRTTYDSFAGAWPGRELAGEEDAEFAKKLGDMRKIVASHQDLELTWRNSEQLQGDLVETVTALKEKPGHIALSGSVSVVRQLLAAGLIDELQLFVHPIAVGRGRSAVRRQLADDPAEADHLAGLRVGSAQPGLRTGHVRPAGHLRGREATPAPR